MNKLDNIQKVKIITHIDEITNKSVITIDGKEIEFSEVVVKMNRVTKVVKGGRRFSFNVLSVVGDKDTYVGFGFGKAKEIVEAIQKAGQKAKHNIIKVKRNGTTIPHEITGKFKSTTVLLKPCSAGTGIIAGNAVRSVVELGGIKDVLTKVQGSTNPLNIVKATILALSQLINIEEAKQRRNINLRTLLGEYSYQRYQEKNPLHKVDSSSEDNLQTESQDIEAEVKSEELLEEVNSSDNP